MLVGAAAIGLSASGLLLAANGQLATVRQTIQQRWRGTYDILVRPKGAAAMRLPGIGEGVPYSFLGEPGAEGISRREWQEISSLPAVEVAAPVSTIGWFTLGGPPMTVELARVKPGDLFRINVSVQIRGRSVMNASAFFGVERVTRRPLGVGISNYAYVPDGRTVLSTGQLPSTWGHVVAVDPPAEDELVGLRRYVRGALDRGLRQTFDSQYNRSATQLPVVVDARSTVPGTVSVRVTQISGVPPEAVGAAADAVPKPRDTQGLAAYRQATITAAQKVVNGASQATRANDTATFEALVPPLRPARVSLGADGRLTGAAESYAPGYGAERAVVLVDGPLDYSHGPGDRLQLRPLGTWDKLVRPALEAATDPGKLGPNRANGADEPLYRNLRVLKPPPFVLEQTGSVDLTSIETRLNRTANYVPLGLYGVVPRMLGGRPLPPSLNPGGLNPPPPVGITNLEAAEFVRGPRFIDAVRVRVSGVHGYDKVALARIEDVAAAIVERTGLRVDVVAGASPILLAVDVQGIGPLIEPWTTLGTAPAIESAASGASLAMLLAAIGVAVAYLIGFGAYLAGDQRSEFATLRYVGWRKRELLTLVALQAAIVAVPSALLVLLITGSLEVALGQPPFSVGTALLLGAILLGHLVAGGLMAGPLSERFARVGPSRGRGRLAPGLRTSVAGLALALIGEIRLRTALLMLAMGVAVALAGIVGLIGTAGGGDLRATVLGQLVRVKIAPYHFLAAAGALLAAAAIVLNTAILGVERRIGVIGVLRAAGWRRSTLRDLVILESCLPAVGAGILAATAVTLIGAGIGAAVLGAALGLVAVPAAGFLAAAAAAAAAGAAASVPPLVAIRAEGASDALPTLTMRATLMSIGLALVLIAGTSLGWAALAPQGASAGSVTGAPTSPPLPADQQRILRDAASIAAHVDRSAASASMVAAMAVVRSRLEALGYIVQVRRFLVRGLDLRMRSGQRLPVADVFPVAVAYTMALQTTGQVQLPVALVDLRPGKLQAGCVRGAALLRVESDSQAPLAAEYALRCSSTVPAVVAVRATPDAWDQLRSATTARFAVGEDLVAIPSGPLPARMMWLVASLDSTGPGASQSAGPTALVLEAARQLRTASLPAGIVIATAAEGSVTSVVSRLLFQSGGSAVYVGPAGGTVGAVIGTRGPVKTDAPALRAGLLATTALDNRVGSWLDRSARVAGSVQTSSALLNSLSQTLALPTTDDLVDNAYPLAVGIDAAYVGEPLIPGTGPASVSGTPVDRAEQLDGQALAQLATGLVRATALLARRP